MWVYTCIIIVFNKNRLLVSSFGDIYKFNKTFFWRIWRKDFGGVPPKANDTAREKPSRCFFD